MIVRRVPIDAKAIAEEAGAHGVLFDRGDEDFVLVTSYTGKMIRIFPPEKLPGETLVTIADNHWCFHND